MIIILLLNMKEEKIYRLPENKMVEKIGGCGAHLSPWIHQEYTVRLRSA